jgi:hypothetical protein
MRGRRVSSLAAPVRKRTTIPGFCRALLVCSVLAAHSRRIF